MLGPNGAGKTTLMKILATLVLPTSGLAYVDGLDVVRHSTEVRSKLGVVYGDERSFFWRLSVRENLRFYAALYGLSGRDAMKKIDELIEMVGLQEAADVRMHYYSTGMKQRAAIARGLLGDPKIIFMDEPTRSLDPIGSHEIHRIIRERLLLDGKHTILLATNNMDEDEALCHRVTLIHKGIVQMMGTIPELQSSFAAGRVYVIVASDLSGEDVAQLERLPGVQSVDINGLPADKTAITVRVEPRSTSMPDVVRLLTRNGVSIWSCGEEVARLEDLFRQAVEKGAPPAERVAI